MYQQFCSAQMVNHSPIDVELVKKSRSQQFSSAKNDKSLPHRRRTGKKSKYQQFCGVKMVNRSPINIELVKSASINSFAVHK